jgi:hypothetical protein
VNKNDRYPTGLIFDEQAVKSVLDAASLSLAEPSASAEFQSRLNHIAAEYYWNEFSAPSRTQGDTPFEFDAVADASVTPSRLNNRLIGIRRGAKRVQAVKSRHPLSARVTELLDRLGYDKEGEPKRYSGTEETGHGGSERSAVWLCLVRAVMSLERPKQGYRPTSGERPWASQRLRAAIDSLAAFLHSPEENHTAALEAASDFHSWAEWSTAKLEPLITSDPARHMGHVALDATILELAALYRKTFDKKPSLSHRIAPGGVVTPNVWQLFLQAVLERVLAPERAPSLSALKERWRRLAYTDRKNRL